MKHLWNVYPQNHQWPKARKAKRLSTCTSETCGCRAVDEGLRGNKQQALGLFPAKQEPPEDNFTYAPEYQFLATLGKASRKDYPIGTGCLSYFPKALLAVSNCSKVGNDQHNPGEPLHWAREKSTDDLDAGLRHLLERGKIDTDGVPHTAKACWRFLAVLEKELEASGFQLP